MNPKALTESAQAAVHAAVQAFAAGFRPTGARLLIQRQTREEFSPGGLLIPQTAQEHAKRGTVLAVGPGRQLDDGRYVPCAVRAGDQALFNIYAGTPINETMRLPRDWPELMMCDEGNILAVIEKEQGR